jgi:hypothetical protein
MTGLFGAAVVIGQVSDSPSPSPSAGANGFPPASFGSGDLVFWAEIGVLVLIALVILMPIILSLTQSRFFETPFITWYLLHFGVGALGLLVLIGLALAGSLTAPLIAVFSGLFGFIFGSSSARAQQPAAAAKTLSVKTVRPPSAPPGSYISVIGEGLDPHATVQFGTAALTDVSVSADGTMLIGRLPTTGQGSVDVTVKNPDNTSKTLSQGFTYQ